MVWETPNQAVERDYVRLNNEMKIGFPSESWCEFVKMAADTDNAPSDRAKKEFKGLGTGPAKKVGEYSPG